MKKGFTLAEVLITLTIIGVVAALTIPELVKNMNDYAFGKSKEVTLAKITEATNQMKSNDVLDSYTTNDAFVDEFQKYMKVTKRCDSTTLVNCFPAKFKTGTGDEIQTSTLTTGTKLGDNNLTNNTIAIMLANGTSMLFTLRDSTKVSGACDRIDPTDNQSSTIGCLSFLYDINGYGSPNVMGKDIGAVNATITACDGTKIGTLCVSDIDLPTIASINTCDGSPDIAWDPHGSTGNASLTCADNRWAAAKKYCDSLNMSLPTYAQFKLIYQDLCGVSAGTACPVAGRSNATAAGFALDLEYWLNEEKTDYQGIMSEFINGNLSWVGKNQVKRIRCVK